MPKQIDINSFVRPNISKLNPYRSARDDFSEGILLDANENSFGAPIKNDLSLHRYPDPLHNTLRKTIADYRQVDMENIFLGVGSDEPIDLLMRIFCEPGSDSILITPPTYGMYRVAAKINNLGCKEVLLSEKFQLRTDEVIQNADHNTKLLYLCSPNNPTANDLKRTDVLKVLEQFPGIVVIDEAYIDFSRQESMAAMVQQYPNLVVLQTFSKAFGLAGIRLGVAISNPAIIGYMLKIKAPYNINKLTVDKALEAYSHLDLIKFNIDKIREEREVLINELEYCPPVERVHPSDANFILFKISHSKEIYQKLATKGVIVRYRGNEPHCDDCLRVTVGTPDENDKFLRTLKDIIS